MNLFRRWRRPTGLQILPRLYLLNWEPERNWPRVLKSLLDQGLITDSDYQAKKEELLAKM